MTASPTAGARLRKRKPGWFTVLLLESGHGGSAPHGPIDRCWLTCFGSRGSLNVGCALNGSVCVSSSLAVGETINLMTPLFIPVETPNKGTGGAIK